jgi:hypothetical protein
MVCKRVLRLLIGVSELVSESPRELAATARKVPANGNGIDAKEGRDRRYRQPLEFVHHDDSPATRRQVVERPPHRRPDEKGPFWIVLDWGRTDVRLVALADGFLAPLISPNVNEHADQPCLLIAESAGNGFR